jgi:hypothetical protein
VVAAAMDARVCAFGWQTYAWSGGVWYAGAQLRQYLNNQRWDTGLVDYDRATVPAYGQWNTTGGDWFNMATQADLENLFKKYVAGTVPPTVAAQLAAIVKALAEQDKILRMMWHGSTLRSPDAHDVSPGSIEGLIANAKLIRENQAAIKTAIDTQADPVAFAQAVVAALNAQGVNVTVDTSRLAADLLSHLGLQRIPPATTPPEVAS